MPHPVPEEHKNLCLTALMARMEALQPEDAEYRECSFLARALSNGWLVSDIDTLRSVYQTVLEEPEGDLRTWGDKIRAHKDRLEKKPGYLERKQAAEEKRLVQEKKVLDLIKDTAKRCTASLAALDKTRVGKSTSSSYDQLHKVLETGSKLGAETSVNDMHEFLRQFTEVSENYSRSHNALVGPFTADGKKRLAESQGSANTERPPPKSSGSSRRVWGRRTPRSACG